MSAASVGVGCLSDRIQLARYYRQPRPEGSSADAQGVREQRSATQTLQVLLQAHCARLRGAVRARWHRSSSSEDLSAAKVRVGWLSRAVGCGRLNCDVAEFRRTARVRLQVPPDDL
jgi:hypothetical protein